MNLRYQPTMSIEEFEEVLVDTAQKRPLLFNNTARQETDKLMGVFIKDYAEAWANPVDRAEVAENLSKTYDRHI